MVKNERLLAILDARGFSYSLFDGSLSNSIDISAPISQHVNVLFEYVYGIPFPQDSAKHKSMADEIARFHHGIQHVTRAAYYLMVFANLYREYGDKDAIKLSDEDVKLLQIAVLFHDSARLDDGKDLWDGESAVLLYFYLRNTLNVSPEKAKLITEATANKDLLETGEVFEINETATGEITWKTTISANSDQREKNIYQKLLHDADCLDVIRVRDEFDNQYLDFYKQFIANEMIIPDPKAITDLAILVEEASNLIALQGDANVAKNKQVKKKYENGQAYDLLVKLVSAPDTNQRMLESLGKGIVAMPEYRPTPSSKRLKTDVAATQLKKGKVLDDIRHQRHRLFASIDTVAQPKAKHVPPQQLERPKLSQSELHLQMIMGKDFNAQAPIAENVEMFLEKYSAVKFKDDEKARLIRQSVAIIENERANPDVVFFYHGVSSEIAYAYTVYTKIYQLLNANSDLEALRVDNSLFHKCLNINEFIAHFLSISTNGLINNYATGYMECALSTNIFLFGNHTVAGSNTIKYYTSNKGATQINLKNMFEASLKTMGVSDNHISQLANLVDSFPENKQGSLYQIGIPMSEVDHYAYTAGEIGILNPVTQTDGRSLSVSHLLEVLQSEDTISSEYIEKVQARVMVPPDAPMSTNQFIWGDEIRPEEKEAFETKLQTVTDQVAQDILQNQNRFNKLNSKTALLRYLPEIMQQAGINPEDEKLSDDLIIQLIETGNFESIKTIVEDYPEVKEKPLVDTRKAYTNKNPGKNEPKTLLERLLAVRFSGDTVRDIYGEHFYEGKLEQLPLHHIVGALPVAQRSQFILFNKDRIIDGNMLSMLLETLPENERFDITKACGEVINSMSELLNVLKRNNEDLRFIITNDHTNLIGNGTDIDLILNLLPKSSKTERVNFVNQHIGKIRNGEELAKIMNSLPEYDRMQFAIEHMDIISDGYNLQKVIKTLPNENKLVFAELNEDKINGGVELAAVLESIIELDDRHHFLNKHEDKIKTGSDLSSVLYILPLDKRAEFANNHKDTIHSGADIAIVIMNLPENDRYNFALSENSKVMDCEQLIDILFALPDLDRKKYALLHLDKINTMEQLKWVIDAMPNNDRIILALHNMNIIRNEADFDSISRLLPKDSAQRFTKTFESYTNLSSDYKTQINTKISIKNEAMLIDVKNILDGFTARISSAETSDMLADIVKDIRKSNQYKKLIDYPDLTKKIMQQKFNPITALNKVINDKRAELEISANTSTARKYLKN